MVSKVSTEELNTVKTSQAAESSIVALSGAKVKLSVYWSTVELRRD